MAQRRLGPGFDLSDGVGGTAHEAPELQEQKGSPQETPRDTWLRIMGLGAGLVLAAFLLWSSLGTEDGVTEVLAHRGEVLAGMFIEVPCSEDYDGHRRFEGCSPWKCGRGVTDIVVTREEAQRICSIAEKGLSLGGSKRGEMLQEGPTALSTASPTVSGAQWGIAWLPGMDLGLQRTERESCKGSCFWGFSGSHAEPGTAVVRRKLFVGQQLQDSFREHPWAAVPGAGQGSCQDTPSSGHLLYSSLPGRWAGTGGTVPRLLGSALPGASMLVRCTSGPGVPLDAAVASSAAGWACSRAPPAFGTPPPPGLACSGTAGGGTGPWAPAVLWYLLTSGATENSHGLAKLFLKATLCPRKDVQQKVQLTIAKAFGISVSSLYLTKPTFFSRMNSLEAQTAHDEYWNAHMDKVTYGSFDYTSLLYLSDYLEDFGGGRFVFMEEGANKTVEPRAGRVSFFTSGSENLHQVEKVHWGTQYTITIAFTCNPDHSIEDPAFT
ncbi:2-oxoglutarate and iron-dependent oxygenase domain-containing protein 3-like [Callospermophilus lateralis]|uniref:2-oxoglutarate and iron-dependent oxygenase domain-containing protein 3-like n=1 Tax=Callospermophilus lateralis TaxID=76772 RepID=UPI004054913B